MAPLEPRQRLNWKFECQFKDFVVIIEGIIHKKIPPKDGPHKKIILM